ncbi:MAG: DUF4249 domain-containing protein [Chitinophagaceae bacterium]|nr:DUF4249 domain-containing protein [Chitinophagaceae bacterium]
MIDFKPKEKAPKLVVEATIENGQPPIVFLSRSVNFFSKMDPQTLSQSFVRNAEVYVSNGSVTHKLREYSVPLGGGYFIYFYSADTTNPSTYFVGELKKTYSLRIVYDGEIYTAQTTIPEITRRIDSLYWKPAPPGNPPNKVALMIRATDRPGYGDYVRYFTKRNQEPFYAGLNSVYDDQIIDGTTYEVQVERGINRNDGIANGYSFFDKGDTVTLKLCNIDKATYDFWRTLEFNFASIGNPFSNPTRIISNISGNSLGYFGGYAAQYKTLIIPR